MTDKATVERTVKQAHDHFGRLDVVISNAGYGLFGAVEEVSEQGSGHIIQKSERQVLQPAPLE